MVWGQAVLPQARRQKVTSMSRITPQLFYVQHVPKPLLGKANSARQHWSAPASNKYKMACWRIWFYFGVHLKSCIFIHQIILWKLLGWPTEMLNNARYWNEKCLISPILVRLNDLIYFCGNDLSRLILHSMVLEIRCVVLNQCNTSAVSEVPSARCRASGHVIWLGVFDSTGCCGHCWSGLPGFALRPGTTRRLQQYHFKSWF